MSTTIKVSAETRDVVKAVGARTGQTADQVVARALVEYERSLFWREYAEAAERDSELADRELWESTVRDGLADG